MKMLKKIVITLAILLCFAPVAPADQFTDATFYIWRLINETRQRPLESIARFGIDEARAREALGADQWVLDRGLPPLALIPELAASAAGHSQDMFRNLFYAFNSQDGRTPSDRIFAAGYAGQATGESIGALAFTVFMDPMEAILVIFSNLLTDELTPGNTLPRNIFNASFSEIGISYSGSLLNLGQGLPLNIYMLVADFGQPQMPRSFLIGNVFRDLDADRFMLPGEAVPGISKVFRIASLPLGTSVPFIPDTPLSCYQIEFPSIGFFILEAWNTQGQVILRQSVFGQGMNQLADMRVE